MIVNCEKVTDLNAFNLYNLGIKAMNKIEIGQRLKIARKKARLTQEELANEVGVSQSYIAKLEAGGADNPGSQVMMDIINATNTSPGFIYYGREEMDNLDDDSIDMAILYSKLPENERNAVKTLLETMNMSGGKKNENQ